MRHRILVVAEDVTLRSTLAQWLMPAGYFVELAETDRRAREVFAKQRMALTIVAPSAGVPMFDPGEKGGKLIVVTERPHDPGLLSCAKQDGNTYCLTTSILADPLWRSSLSPLAPSQHFLIASRFLDYLPDWVPLRGAMINAAFASLVGLHAGTLAVSLDPYVNSRRDQLVALADR